MFYVLLYVTLCPLYIAIILMGKRELISLLGLSSWCLMRGSRNFRQGGGGGPGQSDKKALFFFFFFTSPQLILQKSNGQFHRNLSFFNVPGGSNFFQGAGVQLLIPYINPFNLWFSRGEGVRTPYPPSGSALVSRDCCVALSRGAMGLSAVCDCGIS